MEEASTSNSNSSKENVECEIHMPWPAYSKVFDFRPNLSKEKNLAFACKYCIGGKIIHANKSSAANLKKHLHVSIIYLFSKKFNGKMYMYAFLEVKILSSHVKF